MSKVNVVIGAMAGLAVGALLGVLFAPKQGKETRKKISKKTKDSADSLKGKFNDIVDNAARNLRKTKKEVKEAQE